MSIREKIKGMQTWKKVTILVVLVLVLAALIVGIVVYGYMNSLVDQMHEPTPDDYDLSLVDVDGYINNFHEEDRRRDRPVIGRDQVRDRTL